MTKGDGAKAKGGAPKKGVKKGPSAGKAEAGAKKKAEDVTMKEATTTQAGAKPEKAAKGDVAMKEAGAAKGDAKPEKGDKAKKARKLKKARKAKPPHWVGINFRLQKEKEEAATAAAKLRASKLRKAVERSYTYHQFHVVGRLTPAKPKSDPADHKLFRMKIWAKNKVAAKSKFWFFMKRLKRVKKANGQIIAVNTIWPRKMAIARNYGVWIRCQSRTGTHNMYKEYRDVAMNGAVEQMYAEMASRHRVRAPQIQIIRVAELKASQCKRARVTQFHDNKISFPFVAKKFSNRPPLPHMRSLYAHSRPSVSMY